MKKVDFLSVQSKRLDFLADCWEKKSLQDRTFCIKSIVLAWSTDVRLFLSFCLLRERHKKSRKWQKLWKIYVRKFHPKFFMPPLVYMNLRSVQPFCRIIYSQRIIGRILIRPFIDGRDSTTHPSLFHRFPFRSDPGCFCSWGGVARSWAEKV